LRGIDISFEKMAEQDTMNYWILKTNPRYNDPIVDWITGQQANPSKLIARATRRTNTNRRANNSHFAWSREKIEQVNSQSRCDCHEFEIKNRSLPAFNSPQGRAVQVEASRSQPRRQILQRNSGTTSEPKHPEVMSDEVLASLKVVTW